MVFVYILCWAAIGGEVLVSQQHKSFHGNHEVFPSDDVHFKLWL